MSTLAALIRAHQQDPVALYKVPETARESTPGRYDSNGSQRSPALDRRVEKQAARDFAAENYPEMDPNDIGSFEDIQNLLDLDIPDMDFENIEPGELTDDPDADEGLEFETVPPAPSPMIAALDVDGGLHISDDGLSTWRDYVSGVTNPLGFAFFTERPIMVASETGVKYTTDLATNTWSDIVFEESVIPIAVQNGDFEQSPTFSEFAPGWEYVSGDSPRTRTTSTPPQMPGSERYLTRDWVTAGTGDFEISQTVEVSQTAQDALSAGGQLRLKGDFLVGDGASARVVATSGEGSSGNGYPLNFSDICENISGSGGVGTIWKVKEETGSDFTTQDGVNLSVFFVVVQTQNATTSLTTNSSLGLSRINTNQAGYVWFDIKFYIKGTENLYSGPLALHCRMRTGVTNNVSTSDQTVFGDANVEYYRSMDDGLLLTGEFGGVGTGILFGRNSNNSTTADEFHIYYDSVPSAIRIRSRATSTGGSRGFAPKGPINAIGEVPSVETGPIDMTRAPNYMQAGEATVIFNQLIDPGTDWQSIELVEDPSFPYSEISLNLSAEGTPANVWIDNISLEVVEAQQTTLNSCARDKDGKSFWVAKKNDLIEIKGSEARSKVSLVSGFNPDLLSVHDGSYIAASETAVEIEELFHDFGQTVRQVFAHPSKIAVTVDGGIYRYSADINAFELVYQAEPVSRLSYYEDGNLWFRFDADGPIYTSTDLISWTLFAPLFTLESQNVGTVLNISDKSVFWLENNPGIFHRHFSDTTYSWKFGGAFDANIKDIQVE